MSVIGPFPTFRPDDLGDITSGLVGGWKFSEGSGTTVADWSGNGNTGTFGGSPNPAWDPIVGGLQFTWTSYIDMGNPTALKVTTQGTVSCWVYLTDTSSLPYGPCVSMIDFSGPSNGYWLGWADVSPAKFGWFLADGSGNDNDFQTTPTLSNWYFISFSWDASFYNFYVNAVLQPGYPTPNTITPTEATFPFRVGYNGSLSLFGNVDDVRVYNRALSGSEMATLYANGAK